MAFSNALHNSEHNSPDSSTTSDDEEKDFILNPVKDDLICNINPVADQPIHLTPHNVQSYYFNVGVSILPGIPEELETEEALDTISSRRISKISMRLEDINHFTNKTSEQQNLKSARTSGVRDALKNTPNLECNEIANDSKRAERFFQLGREDSEREGVFLESLDLKALVSQRLKNAERIENIEYISNYGADKPSILKELRSIRSSCCCCSCSPYRKFIWKRRCRTVTDFFLDNILKPLSVSCKDPQFYPILASKVMISITVTMCFTLTPHIALEKNKDFQPEDTTFLLSYVAFSWCLFLVLIPLVTNFSKRKLRVTFIFGLILVGTCMALISKRLTNDIMTISCLLFGFGYGIISYTENMVYRSFISSRKWNTVQGTLETAAGVSVLLIYYVIYKHKLDLEFLLFIALICYYVNAIMWIITPILKDVIIFLSKYYCRRHQEIVI